MSFDVALRDVLGIEGGYVNHHLDRGGKTRYGITKAVAKRHSYYGPMNKFPLELAKNIYRKEYWDVNRLDDVAGIHEPTALEVFDSGVNAGVRTAAKWVQRALNVLNRNGKLFDDLAVDGLIGPATLGAMKKLPGKDLPVLYNTLNLYQGRHYITVVENDHSQEAFFRGWITRVSLNR